MTGILEADPLSKAPVSSGHVSFVSMQVPELFFLTVSVLGG